MWLASTGRALEWCAGGGGSARLKHNNKLEKRVQTIKIKLWTWFNIWNNSKDSSYLK